MEISKPHWQAELGSRAYFDPMALVLCSQQEEKEYDKTILS